MNLTFYQGKVPRNPTSSKIYSTIRLLSMAALPTFLKITGYRTKQSEITSSSGKNSTKNGTTSSSKQLI